VDDLLKKIGDNVQSQNGPYKNAAFQAAQEELKKSIEKEAKKAADEKQKLVTDAIAEIKKQNEVSKL